MSVRRITIPRVKMPKGPKGSHNPPGWGTTDISLRARGLPGAQDFRQNEPAGDPDPEWQAAHPLGTRPEWAIYWALKYKLGKIEGIDFVYQARTPGVGASYFSTIDFLLPPNYIGIEVQGKYWHLGRGTQKIITDTMRVSRFAAQGIKVIFIDEDDALSDPVFYTREAIQGADHSHVLSGRKNI